MILEFTEQERNLLEEILQSESNSLLDELHHTDSFDYRQGLKEKLETLKGLKAKVEALGSAK